MPLYIAQSGDLEGCHACLTDGRTLKDSATQLLIKYKSGALVTQFNETLGFSCFGKNIILQCIINVSPSALF